jgi:hypothetical protein
VDARKTIWNRTSTIATWNCVEQPHAKPPETTRAVIRNSPPVAMCYASMRALNRISSTRTSFVNMTLHAKIQHLKTAKSFAMKPKLVGVPRSSTAL